MGDLSLDILGMTSRLLRPQRLGSYGAMPKRMLSKALRSGLAALVLAGLGGACAKNSSVSVSPGSNPFRGRSLYVESRTDARKQAIEWREFRPDDAALMNQLSKQPTALWLRNGGVAAEFALRTHVRKAMRQGTLPIVVVDGIPNRDCDRVKAGDLEPAAEYRRWIEKLRETLGRSPVVVVLEPEALRHLETCLQPAQQEERLTLLREAASLLEKGTRATVYLAAGIAGNEPPDIMAKRLQRAGIAEVRGFALNAGDYVDTKRTITYGVWLAELLGDKPFIVDTSRNGYGAPEGDTCNARERALGLPPTLDTRHRLIDAYLWLATPGISDGECNGGPPKGEWWPKLALELVRNTSWIRAAALLPAPPTPPLPPEPGPRDELEIQMLGARQAGAGEIPPAATDEADVAP